MSRFFFNMVLITFVLSGCISYVDKGTDEIKRSFNKTLFYKGIFILKKGKYIDDMVKKGSPLPYIFKFLVEGMKTSILGTHLFSNIVDRSNSKNTEKNEPGSLDLLIISDMLSSKNPDGGNYAGEYSAAMRIGCIIRTTGISGRIIYYRLYETSLSIGGFEGNPYMLCLNKIIQQMLNDIEQGSFDDPSYMSIELDAVKLSFP